MVCASEKYASEIEIFTFGRASRTRISRSSVQKRRFHQSMIRQFGQTDFFNRIGRSLPVMSLRILLVNYGAHDWSGRTQMGGGKSLQLPNCDLKMAESKILML